MLRGRCLCGESGTKSSARSQMHSIVTARCAARHTVRLFEVARGSGQRTFDGFKVKNWLPILNPRLDTIAGSVGFVGRLS